ncbi:gamma-glutamylcyclotransferase family protein [Patescibacteria group bacterium]
MKIKYFAYGSNMDLSQMTKRCENNFKLLGVAKLKGWEFYINNQSKANIAIDITNSNSVVYGLLFEVNKTALGSLDRYEGYNKVPKTYDRDLENIKFKEDEIEAWVYIDKRNLETGKSDSTDYLERIIQASKSLNFPSKYITHLESFL